jgi:hypothetical protein
MDACTLKLVSQCVRVVDDRFGDVPTISETDKVCTARHVMIYTHISRSLVKDPLGSVIY